MFAGIPHHITRRGIRRENFFFTDDDCVVYLGLPRLINRKTLNSFVEMLERVFPVEQRILYGV
jgi:hypothetical protein